MMAPRLTCFGRRGGYGGRGRSWRVQWRWILRPDPFRRGPTLSSCGSSPAAEPSQCCFCCCCCCCFGVGSSASDSVAPISNSKALKLAPLNWTSWVDECHFPCSLSLSISTLWNVLSTYHLFVITCFILLAGCCCRGVIKAWFIPGKTDATRSMPSTCAQGFISHIQ